MNLVGTDREDITLCSVQSAADRVTSDINTVMRELPGTLTSRAPDGKEYTTYTTEDHGGPRAALSALRALLYNDMPLEADCVWWRVKPEVRNDPETDQWRAYARLRFGKKADTLEQAAVGSLSALAPAFDLHSTDWPAIGGSLGSPGTIAPRLKTADTRRLVDAPDTPHDFADAPRTLGEVRADKTRKAHDWSPRDMLVQLLREIDSGTVATEHMVIVMRVPNDDGKPGFQTDARRAGGDCLIALGLLTMASSSITDPE
jgi:hypothetical protein